jgi:hypothetical protein
MMLLESKGLDSMRAQEIFEKLIADQNGDLAEMDQLLDILDG